MSTPFLCRCKAVAILLAVLPLSACLFRSHPVDKPVVGPLKTATQQELIDYLAAQAAKVQNLQATVDIDTNVGGAKKGKVVEYQQIRGYVFLRSPAMLRMVGLAPLVRNTLFDMVSDGRVFKLWIPTKNRFIIGRNDLPGHNSTQALENLRPHIFYDAMIIHPIDPQNEIAVLETQMEIVPDAKGRKIEHDNYVLDVVRKRDKDWVLERKIIFSRADLLPHQELVYDGGEVVTNSQYHDYRDTDGVNFPQQIQIVRPQEEYDITLTMVKLQLNQGLPDDKFVLEQPPGVDVVHLDKQDNAPSNGPQGSH